MSEAGSLTGVWQGFYAYASTPLQVGFVASLIDGGGSLSGTIHEVVGPTEGEAGAATVFATVSGSRAGAAVSFVKTYDGTGGWSHSVVYEGQISADETEIEGTWTIPKAGSGRFLMIRNRGVAKTVEERVREKV